MFALRSCEQMLRVEAHACARLNGVTIHGPNMWSAIVVTYIAHELAGQDLNRGEDPAHNNIAVKLGEPVFDLEVP